MTQTPTLSRLPDVVGGYEIVTDLYSGGMGDVLLGCKRGAHRFQKLVAVKTIRAELRERQDLRRMFLDEARLSALLHHPNIAQVYDFGEQDDLLYLVMEYVAGISLTQLFRDGLEPPGPGPAARAMAAVCRGLHAAHESVDHRGEGLGVVHRDVSPQNLMITFDGSIKIIDFGIARMRDREAPATVVGDVKGKPGYMAPEQLDESLIDRRTDVFSAGIVTWELLTSRRLFKANSLAGLAHAVMNKVIEPPSAFGAPPLLDPVVKRALEREPSARYQTMAEMAADLDAAAAAIGDTTLAGYVQRVLTTKQDEHRRWLHALLEDSASHRAPAGRAAGVNTASVLAEPSRKTPARGTELPPTIATTPEPSAGRFGRWLGVMTALAVLAGLGGWGWFSAWQASANEVPTRGATEMRVRPETLPAVDPQPLEDEPPSLPPAEPTSKAVDVVHTRVKRPGKSNRRGTGAEKRTHTKSQPNARVDRPKGTGFLTIGADPYADVFIDGKDRGATPLFNLRVSAGEHLVELRDPRTGEPRLRKKLVVSSGAEHVIRIP